MRISHPRPRHAVIALIIGLLTLTLTAVGAAELPASALNGTDVAAEASAQLTAAERQQLESAAVRLDSAGTPTKFVVLGSSTGTKDDLVRYAISLRQAVGERYAVVVLSASPRRLAIASALSTAANNRIFANRTPALKQDPVAGMVLVAQDISAQVLGSTPSNPTTTKEGGGGGGSILPFLGVVAVGGAAAVGLSMASKRRRRRRVQEQQELEKATLDPLVDGLAAQINELDPQMALTNERTQAAKADYQEAVLTYADARDAVAAARTPTQIRDAGAMLEKGLRAARRAKARLEGRPVEQAEQEPLLEGLCTFDPKHGRAVGNATVTAPDGRTAEVPVCAECRQRMQEGRRPDVREVEVGGRSEPYWQTNPGGMGMGGMLNGTLLGILLGGMFGGGGAMGQEHHHGGGDGGGWPDQWSGGDAGGGGGGGDFGGGGGDFGGGGGDGGGGGGGGDF